MIVNQTQPFPVSRVRAAHTLSIYGDGICMEGKPGLMDQERCWNSFVVTSGKRSGSVFRFDERKGIHCLFCPLIFFRGSCCHNIIYICIYIDLAMCELLLCIAVLRGKSPVAWWWCRYGHYRLHIMPDVPCVCVCLTPSPQTTVTVVRFPVNWAKAISYHKTCKTWESMLNIIYHKR